MELLWIAIALIVAEVFDRVINKIVDNCIGKYRKSM